MKKTPLGALNGAELVAFKVWMKRYKQNLNAGGVQPLNYTLPPTTEVENGPIVQETSLVGTNIIFLSSMIVGGRAWKSNQFI